MKATVYFTRSSSLQSLYIHTKQYPSVIIAGYTELQDSMVMGNPRRDNVKIRYLCALKHGRVLTLDYLAAYNATTEIRQE